MDKKTSSNQIKWGALLSYGQMGISIIIGLLYTPLMLDFLGQSEYGLYSTVSSTIATLHILNLGFDSAYIRYFAKYKKECNEQAIQKLNGLFLTIFSIIGILALICGLFLSFNLEYVFDAGLTIDEYTLARTLMLLLSISTAISFPMTVFTTIINAHERYVLLKVVGLLRTVLSPLATFPLLLMGYGSVAIVVITIILALIADCIHIYYIFVILKVKVKRGQPESGILRSMVSFIAFIALNIIVDQINWNMDKILLGRFRGTVSVAIYSIGYTLFMYYNSFSKSISSVFTPRIHKIVNETKNNLILQRQTLTDLFTKVGRIQYLILGLIASGVVFFGKAFITALWAGPEYENSYYVALWLILPASIALIQNLGIEIQRAENKHQFRSIIYAIMAVINLILTIYLCQRFGAVGSAIGTAISLIVANGLIMNIYYHKKCNIDIICFWKNISRMSSGLLLPIIAGILLNRYLDLTNPIIFVLGVLLYTVIYCSSMWLFGMNKYEKDLVTSPIKKLFRK